MKRYCHIESRNYDTATERISDSMIVVEGLKYAFNENNKEQVVYCIERLSKNLEIAHNNMK